MRQLKRSYRVLPNIAPPNNQPETAGSRRVSLRAVHELLAHVNKAYVKRFLETQNIDYNDDIEQCSSCIMGKQTRASYHSRPAEAKATRPGSVADDLCSPATESLGHSNHFLTITDEFSKFRKVYFLSTKDETIECIQKYINWFRNVMGRDLTRFHSDEGREFRNRRATQMLDKIGCEQTFSPPRNPSLNGAAERSNRTVVNLVRAVLFGAGLEHKKFLWAECTGYVVTLMNISILHETFKKSPYEIIYNKKPYVGHLQPFGAECFVRNHKDKPRKFERRSSPARLMGYTPHGLGYRVWVPGTQTILESEDVVFIKKPILHRIVKEPSIERNETDPDGSDQENVASDVTTRDQEASETEQQNELNIDNTKIGLRSRSELRRPKRFDEEIYVSDAPEAFVVRKGSGGHNVEIEEEEEGECVPISYQEAMSGNESENWKQAIKKEIGAIEENGVWEPAELPRGKIALDSKWLFRIKINDPATKAKTYKARLVLRGFRQRKNIDYNPDQIFSPVCRQECIRTVLSIAAEEKLYAHQFDVVSAFLTADLPDAIYMKKPEGVNTSSGTVLRLRKSLYGMKQSPWLSHEKLTKVLLSKGLSRSLTDPCLFFKNTEDRMIVTIYVDDGLIIAKSKGKVEKFIESLKQDFKVTSKPLSYYLGIQIEVNENFDYHIHQTRYVEQLLEKFGMSDCKPVSTPCDRSIYAEKAKEGDVRDTYRSLVGGLSYLAISSRIDISFVTSYLCRYLDKSTPEHLELAKRVLRYLKHSASTGITYRSASEEKTVAFSDADHGSDPEDRKSVSGVLIMRMGGPVLWQSTKQSSIAISSLESEYYASSEAVKSVMWMNKLLGELGISEKITIHMDSQSAIAIIKSPALYRRSKHIELRLYFVRQAYQEGKIDITFVKSEDQRADILTKGLCRAIYLQQKKLLGLESW